MTKRNTPASRGGKPAHQADERDGADRPAPKTIVAVLAFSSKERRTLVRLLGRLQDHLQSAIESCIQPGQKEPTDEIERVSVMQDRREWREAEDLIRRLEARL